ncbi:hypothetical protein N7533_001801 [Penicillium manginii]|uniref:uncharacterized protein n=1 Tax=Penicillium manginii TaxID=203109 RepID=UPI002549084C|nr:uncharacterized protein N7533_001801 [Penicillium manginii]KAJ5763120.1 hypothetical protein N7533_001801 [Penicillium manginii]
MERLRDPAVHPSSLVSPKNFLFSDNPVPRPVRSLLPRAMDKSQQPSSFQQLEKVSCSSPMIYNVPKLTSFRSSSWEKALMPLYVPIFHDPDPQISSLPCASPLMGAFSILIVPLRSPPRHH